MRIYIGIPIYGSAEPEFIKSLRLTTKVLEMLGHEVEVDMHTGCAIITKARNSIVKRFIDSGFDKLLFIDSDMVWNAVDAVNIIQSKHDVCGIAYRQRFEEIKYNAVLNGDEDGKWLGADSIGTGFMCLSRACIESMTTHYPETKYIEDGHIYHALFDFEIIDEQYWGEDYNFCRRWKNKGGKIWVWPADIGHIGKKIYSGNIKEITQ